MEMDERIGLLMQVVDTLEKGNFEVSERCGIPSCFDIFARKDVLLLLMKILTNIDSLNEHRAKEMLIIAKMFAASPLLIGYRTRNSYLEEGIVYERYGVPAVSPETLKKVLLEKILPIILSARGGYYVKINAPFLREIRKERGISLGELGDKIGVSRRTIYKYEQEGAGATFETALRLEEYLDESIVMPIEIFLVPKDFYMHEKEVKGELERLILDKLVKIGFQVYPIRRAPFDALTKSEDDLLLTKVVKLGLKRMIGRARVLKSISDTAQTEAFFVVESDKSFKTNFGGIPVIKRDELEEIQESDELVETIDRRKRFI